MVLDPTHLKFTRPVRIRGERIILIRTVEESIDWIDDHGEPNVRQGLSFTKAELHKANDARTVAAADHGREVFTSGLEALKLLYK